ncbi:hypothetical protein CDV31_000804 [Fusarium ambrosium]|uniref:Uncharacterized protein n=1 Tax=Fusarium ambrosium TaxID=131363 RepID=A0A428V182_9HYPO|nr:hypothetical protein CDV31_000804 [Fusarium ambrosium]
MAGFPYVGEFSLIGRDSYITTRDIFTLWHWKKRVSRIRHAMNNLIIEMTRVLSTKPNAPFVNGCVLLPYHLDDKIILSHNGAGFM